MTVTVRISEIGNFKCLDLQDNGVTFGTLLASKVRIEHSEAFEYFTIVIDNVGHLIVDKVNYEYVSGIEVSKEKTKFKRKKNENMVEAF